MLAAAAAAVAIAAAAVLKLRRLCMLRWAAAGLEKWGEALAAARAARISMASLKSL